MLRDSARFAFCDMRGSNGVKKGRLTMIHVAHHRNDRSSRQLDIVGIGGDQFLEFLRDDHLLERNEADVIAKAYAKFHRHLFPDGLVESCENSLFDQLLNDVPGGNAQGLSKFTDGRAFGETNWLV